jgi:hypothetical protein
LNMPPKSTWVEPKLRSGLTIYSLEAWSKHNSMPYALKFLSR